MKRRIYVISTLCYAALIFMLSSIPTVPFMEKPGIDKVGHVIEYSILGFLVLGCFVRKKSIKTVLFVIFVCSLYGVFNEVYQQLVPGRYSSGLDMLANSLGSILGVAINLWYTGRKKLTISLVKE